MANGVDELATLGVEAAASVWLPVAAWTLIAAAAGYLLRLRPLSRPFTRYAVQSLLLTALPLSILAIGINLPALLGPSVPDASPAAPIVFSLTTNLSTLPKSGVWSVAHTIGFATLLAGLTSLIGLARLAREYGAFLRFRRRLPTQQAQAIQHLADELARGLGIRRRVRVVVATDGVVPMTYGWLHPTVVVPAELESDSSALRMALMHELIHVRRCDYAHHWMTEIIAGVFGAHPLVRQLKRSLSNEREKACDAAVLCIPGIQRSQYARLLYRYALSQATAGASLTMARSEPEITQRILAMKYLTPVSSARPWSRFTAPLLLVLLLGVTTLVVACTEVVDVETTEPVTTRTQAQAEVGTAADEMPELIGGLAAVMQDLRYPEIARKAGIEGKVIVEFVVDERGEVTNAHVVQGIGGGCDEEALRVVRNASFRPGTRDGEPVPVKLSMPITFRLK